jgi:CRP-like cAMP-binding protein
MKPDLQTLLSKSPLFSTLDPPVLKLFFDLAVFKSLPQGVFLTLAGDIWPYLFLVVEGKLNAVKESSEGRTFVIAELDPGEVFWGLAFFEKDIPNPMSIQSNDASSVYLWSRGDILNLLIENGRMSWELSRLMVDRMLHASTVIEGLAFQPVAGRLAQMLTKYYGHRKEDAIERNLTLDEMAARIGSTREMVCRILHRFAEEQIIDITRTEFRITDKGKLENYLNIRK